MYRGVQNTQFGVNTPKQYQDYYIHIQCSLDIVHHPIHGLDGLVVVGCPGVSGGFLAKSSTRL